VIDFCFIFSGEPIERLAFQPVNEKSEPVFSLPGAPGLSYTGKLYIRHAVTKETVKEFDVNRRAMSWDNSSNEFVSAVGDGMVFENLYFAYWNISLRNVGSYELVMNVLDGDRVVASESVIFNVSENLMSTHMYGIDPTLRFRS
jgi:hypothetical protein